MHIKSSHPWLNFQYAPEYKNLAFISFGDQILDSHGLLTLEMSSVLLKTLNVRSVRKRSK